MLKSINDNKDQLNVLETWSAILLYNWGNNCHDVARTPNTADHTLDVASPTHCTASLLLETDTTRLVYCFTNCYLQSSR